MFCFVLANRSLGKPLMTSPPTRSTWLSLKKPGRHLLPSDVHFLSSVSRVKTSQPSAALTSPQPCSQSARLPAPCLFLSFQTREETPVASYGFPEQAWGSTWQACGKTGGYREQGRLSQEGLGAGTGLWQEGRAWPTGAGKPGQLIQPLAHLLPRHHLGLQSPRAAASGQQ